MNIRHTPYPKMQELCFKKDYYSSIQEDIDKILVCLSWVLSSVTDCWLILHPVKSKKWKLAACQRRLSPAGAERQERVLGHRSLAPRALLAPEHAPACACRELQPAETASCEWRIRF